MISSSAASSLSESSRPSGEIDVLARSMGVVWCVDKDVSCKLQIDRFFSNLLIGTYVKSRGTCLLDDSGFIYLIMVGVGSFFLQPVLHCREITEDFQGSSSE